MWSCDYHVTLQVCWAMLSITVAVRIDVYGVVYAVLLGILLVLPRPILPPVWLLYLFLHGVLLLVQYFFLLGAPAGICYTHTHANSTGVCVCVGVGVWVCVGGGRFTDILTPITFLKMVQIQWFYDFMKAYKEQMMY